MRGQTIATLLGMGAILLGWLLLIGRVWRVLHIGGA